MYILKIFSIHLENIYLSQKSHEIATDHGTRNLIFRHEFVTQENALYVTDPSRS